MTAFSVIPELRIGSIVEVAGTSLRIELDGGITELTRTYGGVVYPIGQVASVIKVHYGRLVLVAYVRLLRMRSEIAREQGLPIPPPSEDARIIDADLFGECAWSEARKSLAFMRGVSSYPLPGQSVYLVTQDELRYVYRTAELFREDSLSPLIPIGTYVGAAGTKCYANIDRLFGLHCAVLGSTGIGKSATVAAIMHSLLSHKPDKEQQIALRPRILIIDPHGEYAKAFGDKSILFRAYNMPAGDEQPHGRELRLPYWLMNGEEFRDLVIGKTEYEATSENNIVHKALRHARLAKRGWIEAAKDWLGNKVGQSLLPEEPRPVSEELSSRIAQYDSDTPDPFSLDEFERHVALEQGVRIDARKNEWCQLSPSDFKSHASVLNKLTVLRTDPRLSFMMSEHKDGDPDLPQILQQFVGNMNAAGTQPDLRIVDISGLPNEVAGPLTAAIARLLFQYKVWQTRTERERDPVLLVCEEAHRYVPDTGLAEYQSAQRAIRRLAKEGRKYGIGLFLVSQRPSDVERTVLSQCNTWIVMRLTNSTDQEHVSRFLPDSLSGLARLLPSLSRQEAIFVGEAAAVPARIMIRDLSEDELPRSDDVSFVQGWSQPPVDLNTLETIVARWRNENN
jgi:DNA helicase HerA-like ATPase